MRIPRIKEKSAALYHVISRVVDKRMIFTNEEKERFLHLMRAVEGFTACEVLAYSIMGNHFHILLHVPDREHVGDDVLLARMACLYTPKEVSEVRNLLATGDTPAAAEFRESCFRRMYDLSEFAKTLKQRFSQQYNRAHKRKGTLWEERFKSVLLEDRPYTRKTVAAYIELNPLRAGLVNDPKDYRYSSYGEAVGGGVLAQQRLCRIMGAATWSEAAEAYRVWLYQAGAPDLSRPGRINFTKEQVVQVEELQGSLPSSVLLYCRIRYFTDGLIIGSRMFVDEAFQRHRDHFSAKRTDGARILKGAWDDLCCARRLQKQPISLPAG